MRPSSRACAALLVTSALSTPAIAQLAPPPVRQSVDKNGVDLFLGTFNARGPVLSLGQSDQGVSYYQTNTGSGWGDNLIGEVYASGSTLTVWLEGKGDSFTSSGGVYTSTEGNGSTLTFGTYFTYTRADGTVVTFNGLNGRAGSITLPNGAKLTFNYSSIRYCTSAKQGGSGLICTTHGTMSHLSSLTSSYGYNINLDYAFDSADFDPDNPMDNPDAFGWDTFVGVSGLNLAAGSGASTPSQGVTDTTISGSTYHILTDAMGRQTQYRMSGSQIVGITLPGSTSEDETVNYTSGRVTSVVTPAGTTTYSSSDAGNVRTVTVTDPLSHVTTYTFDIPSNRMTSVTDPNNHTTSMVYDSNGRMTKLTKPEGNYTTWTYDPRGNITQVDQTAKSGSGLPDIITTANYDSTCTYAAKCNKPNWTKDAKGNETDYTYDPTTGNLLTVTLPAATTGANRPQTRYGYTQLQAYYANSLGSIVASGLPVYRLTSISQCQTGSSCSGTSDEVKTTISYGPQTTGVGNNLLPVSISKGDGTGALTATSAYTYDDIGNRTYVDGPLAGTADTTRSLYDADREVIGTISPDPDGAGSLQNRAVRNTIDSRGLLTRVETGATNGQSDSAWSAFATAQQVDITYDTRRRITTKELSAGGTPYALTQTSYNADDSLNCTAVRMNTAVYGSLPSSACTQGTAGSFGPDQISQNNYDPAGQLSSIQVAVGTGDAATERTLTYTNNGKLASLKDGMNNLTTYVYDGFDRLSQTQYPSATQGAGTSNPSDYEQASYDANSNVTQRRVRSGATINFAFDNLNRLTSKTSASLPEVDYTYDLLNRALTAKFTSGQGITNVYDALGRVTSSTTNVGGTSRALTYAYDLAGNRTQMNWWDGFYVNYDRFVTGEISAVRENGATSGAGVLATYAYNNLGKRTSLAAGNGTVTSWSYDPVGRLASLTQDLAGTANDLTVTNSYSPASQIVGQTRSNDTYAYTQAVDVNRGYTSNGLNQYSTAGPASFTYDANGNLKSNGTNTFTYDAENKLTSTSGAASTTLSYDPLDRLDTYNPGSAERFIYDGNEAVAELDSSGNIIARFVRGDGADELLVQYPDSGTSNRRWVHLDERNSVIALTDSNGNVTATNRYDEYGVPQSTNSGLFQYTGQMWLSQAGLQFSKARIYSPTLGRFLQTDPVGYGDGPNWYAYAQNEPVNGRDPTGLKTKHVVWTATPTTGPSQGPTQFQTGDNPTISYQDGVAGVYVGDPGGTPTWEPLSPVDPASSSFLTDLLIGGAAGGIILLGGGPEDPIGDALAADFVAEEMGVGVAEAGTGAGELEEGTTLYRVYGGESGPYGDSWTTVDPSTVPDFRDAAGLPNENTGQFVIEGTLNDPSGVWTRGALELDGNGGGLDEVVMPHGSASSKVDITNVSGANPPF